MITQTINVNLIHGAVMPRVNVSQYDSGSRTLLLSVYENTTPFSLLATYNTFIQGTKPDNHGFQYAGVIDTLNNTVSFDVTQQMTAVAGNVTCELVITDEDDNRIATGNFVISVEKAALSDTTVISDTDLPLIEEAAELAQRIDGIIAQIDEDADRAEEGADDAEAWAVGEVEGTPVSSDAPQYENNAKYYSDQAAATVAGAEQHAEDAEAWAVGERNGTPVSSGDATFENNAKYYAGEAQTDATAAGNSATAAGNSATNAEAWAVGERNGTPVSSGDATFENNAKYYAGEAQTDATAAGNSATTAGTNAETSEAWAVGTKNGTPVSSGDAQFQNNAKYWSDVASQFAGGVVFRGSILFANLPTSGMINGDMYDIKDAFTTTADFEEGAGIYCVAGTDIIWVAADSKWNILTPSGVSTFNGRMGAVLPAANDYDASQIKFGVSSNVNSELGNKLPTYAADSSAWDSTPAASSNKPVTSDGINSALGNKLPTYAADSSAWDSTPVASSNKPVTSDGVNSALGNKLPTYAADSSAWDSTPVSSSNKPVTSDGINSAINNVTPIVSTTDIGEGAALASGKLYIVVS